MSEIHALQNLKDISFIDGITLEGLRKEVIADYQKKYFETTGKPMTLYPADPMRILINSFVLQLFQGYLYIDRAGKQNLLRYSYGPFLDHIGALKGIERLPAKAAKVTLRFFVSAIQSNAIPIPKGTRVSSGDMNYFATETYSEIPPGESYVDIPCVCIVDGTAGNGYEAGQLNVLVDPIPYIKGVENTNLSEGGSDVESDESFSERIYLAPSAYSTAGPKEAYIYWMKTYSSSISDVRVEMPAPGEVDIRIILDNGVIPKESFLTEAKNFICNSNIRPLTDQVTVAAPDVVFYDLSFTYYINQSDSSKAESISAAVDLATQSYIAWQKEKIGRDINPSELIYRIRKAGAKRVDVSSPIYTDIGKDALAVCNAVSMNYGGIEDD